MSEEWQGEQVQERGNMPQRVPLWSNVKSSIDDAGDDDRPDEDEIAPRCRICIEMGNLPLLSSINHQHHHIGDDEKECHPDLGKHKIGGCFDDSHLSISKKMSPIFFGSWSITRHLGREEGWADMILGETITREEGGPLHPPVEQQLLYVSTSPLSAAEENLSKTISERGADKIHRQGNSFHSTVF